MKKSLVALAALAVVGIASAQSSVTLYGVADISLAKASNADAAVSTNGLLNDGNSRIGFKGTEDLGGGLKASFTMEQAVDLANGGTNTPTFQRAAWLGLSGGFGGVRLGRSLSPHFYAIATYELTGTANYSAVANKFGFGGATRNDSFIAYTTPNMSGFSATIGTKLAGNNAGNAKTELNLTYANGPLAAAVGYDKTEGSPESVSAGASYNFGSFQVAAGYYDPAGVRKGYSLGVKAPMGAWTFIADMAYDSGSAVTSTDTVLVAQYALSKRTFVYGVGYNAGLTDVNTFGVGIRHNF